MISRSDFGKQFQRCWVCDAPNGFGLARLQTHEIARGAARAKAVLEPCCWLRVCGNCHEDVLATLNIAAQIALVKIHNPSCYNRVRVNELRGRAPNAVTEEEVDAEVARLR